jgi:hypothetical protein
MNPIRAKLSAKPEDWPHSSYRTCAFGRHDHLVTDPVLVDQFNWRSDEARE